MGRGLFFGADTMIFVNKQNIDVTISGDELQGCLCDLTWPHIAKSWSATERMMPALSCNFTSTFRLGESIFALDTKAEERETIITKNDAFRA